MVTLAAPRAIASRPPRRRQDERAYAIVRRLAVAAAIGLSIAWLIWSVSGFTLSDAHAYRTAADRLLSGEDLYQPARTQAEAFRYAPWFAAAWVPITALPFAAGQALWAFCLFCASVLAVLPLLRRQDPTSRLMGLLGGTVLIWTAARGNVHPLVVAALVHGIDRRSGPIWIAAAASLKAVPILFVLVYIARGEWRRAFWTIVLTAALVAPMPLLGWDIGASQPGRSISLFSQVSPVIWAVVASIAVTGALAFALRRSRHSAMAAATAAVLALPRLLLYDLTYLLVAARSISESARATETKPVAPATEIPTSVPGTGAKMLAPGPS